MKRDKLREVDYTGIIDDRNMIQSRPARKGYFHHWGSYWEDGQITAAIVEDAETGEIRRVFPDHLRFTDITPTVGNL